MHNAPPVSYPVGRSRFLARLQWGLWLLGAATVGAWCVQVEVLGWRQVVGVLALAVAGVLAGWGWLRMPVGTVRWDGQKWFWVGVGEPCIAVLRLHVDWQPHMLLSLQLPDGLRLWCWVERASLPPRWRDLRRAVYSPARTHSDPDSALLSEP